MMLQSFENRFMILPMGVVSKNAIGERMMCFNMLLCRRFEAVKAPKLRVKTAQNIDVAANKQRINYSKSVKYGSRSERIFTLT